MSVAVISERPESVFRTEAWVQAWIDTWGKDKRLTLIDLGGSANALEHIYIIKQPLKKIIPVKTLCLAGVGCSQLPTPRAEYNDISKLVNAAGGLNSLAKVLNQLDWQQLYMPDILAESFAGEQWQNYMAANLEGLLTTTTSDVAYAVDATNLEDYLRQLGGNTRLTYFNRRKNLTKIGCLEFKEFEISESHEFFDVLNRFHVMRWGRPCYSSASQKFLTIFFERLTDQQGKVIMQGMKMNGDVVSVLLDVIWSGVRYNLQSGYYENLYPKIALGAVHMGYGIEKAIENKQIYDFLAGLGKNSNYKSRVATREQELRSYRLERGLLQKLRKIQKMICN